MSMFPNCRAKYTKDAYPGGGAIFRRAEDIPEDEINSYWEGNLGKQGKRIVGGYDAAMDEVDMFFKNISETIYQCVGEYDSSQVDDAVMCDERWIDEYDDNEISKMTRQTYILKTLQSELLMKLECYRNVMITTLIDDKRA